MKKTSNKNKHYIGKMIAAGATVAAAAAAGYILFGPDGKKNRRKISGWAVKMKGDIIEKFEQAKTLSEPIYHEIVDQVAKKYEQQKSVSKQELRALVTEMKKHWKDMAKSAGKTKSRRKR